jgi:hypothetical protein
MTVEKLNRHIDIDQLHSRLLYLGLVMDVLIPMILLFIGAFLKSRGVGANVGDSLKILFFALIIAGASDIPVVYIIKKSFLSARTQKTYQKEKYGEMEVESVLFRWGILIFSLSLSPTIYGLVYYFLGGTFERFVLFVAITMFCFLIFKPKLDEIRSFVENRLKPLENVEKL